MKVEEKESGKGITNGLTMTVTVDGNTVSGTDWNSKNNKNSYEIDDAKKLTINNSRKISITGTKTWKDQNNACNRRPDAADPKKVVLTVLANGKQATPQPKVTWDTTNDGTGTWTYKIEGLAKEDANGPIEYTVKEEKVPGYQAAYEQQTKAGKTEVIIVTAKVAQDTPEKLSDTTEYRKDPQSKGYLNTMTAINVKGTYTDKDDKGNDKSVVVTEKEFPTELADKKATCTTPVQVAAPKTGDSANLILYGGIAMVSLVLLLGVLIIFLVKRRHK